LFLFGEPTITALARQRAFITSSRRAVQTAPAR
jgi:hypothetical protein